MTIQSHARVVVIGGGVAGCSTLYHLTQLGWRDVVLVERDELTSGSTWHAAGNCPSFSGSWNMIKLQYYSTQLYARLGAETDMAINYHQTGSIRLAHNTARMEEFQHVCAMAKAIGIEFEMLSPAEIKERHPFLETHEIIGGLWDPSDGDIDPSQVTQALAKGARDGGAKIYRFNPVQAISRTAGGEWRVHTKEGDITCEIVVNAGGYRANEVAALVGVQHPIISMEHQYLVTETVAELEALGEARLPLVRDPDVSYYLRQERHGLILGPYERHCKAWAVDGVPPEFGMELLPDDLDRLSDYIEDAMRRMPMLADAGIQRVINGPIPYTPDGFPLVGPVYNLPNFYACAAFSFGIVQGGGAGKLAAEIITEGQAEWDSWFVDPRRYTAYANKQYALEKALELYSREYDIAYPFEERPAGRPARTSALYDTLKSKGAQFGARGGWERATWFPPPGSDPREQPSHHRTNWFEAVGAECRAVRERVGVLDLGGFSKYHVSGSSAPALLDSLVCGRLPKVGRMALSYCCNARGGIISEWTVTRLAENEFYICSAAGAEWHDHQHLCRHAPDNGSVQIENITPQYGTLILTGPNSREVLAQVTETDLGNSAFPWMSAQYITIGYARVLALRVSYAGELGWELHVPSEYQIPVYQALMAVGESYGVIDFGMYALDALRMEKCYRAWKVDLVDEYTPFEASLDRFVALDKGDFLGREALQQQQQQGVRQRLVPLLIDTENTEAPFCASVVKDHENVGLVGSSGYGYTLEKSIALAVVRSDLAVAGTALTVDIFGQSCTAVVAEEPLYDPQNKRLRA